MKPGRASLRVGQAVVTDPGGDSAGGYVLVAASPSVRTEEGLFLKRSSGISEHLHRSERPGPYFTFLPLPRAEDQPPRYALIRRFVSGRSRGVHRVVVHMLVVPRDLLADLDWDAALLSTHCVYTPLDAAAKEPLRLPDLGAIAAAPGLDALPDLGCHPPTDVAAARREARGQRVEYLQREWGETVLLESLAWVFHNLLTGQGALLPQALPYQQLLTLAATNLPPYDRRRLAWSTHFAPGVQARFRLLNAPDPDKAQRMQADPSEWSCLPTSQQLPAVDASAKTLGAALAWVVLHEPEVLAAFERGFSSKPQSHRWSPSLLRDAGRSQRYLAWLRSDARGVQEGFTSLDDFGAFLRAYREGWSRDAQQRDPWLDADLLLESVARTAHAQLSSGSPAGWLSILGHLQQRIEAAEWGDELPVERVVGALLRDFERESYDDAISTLVEYVIVPMLRTAPDRGTRLASAHAALVDGKSLQEAYRSLEKRVVPVLDRLADANDAQTRFGFELEKLRHQVEAEGRRVSKALLRLDDLASKLTTRRGYDFALPGERLMVLFPADPRPRCELLLQTLLDGRTRPSIKEALQGQWPLALERLERAGEAGGMDIDWLPVPARLAKRGRVFWDVSKWLGRHWDLDPAKVAEHLAYALKHQEYAAVQVLLEASLRRRGGASADTGWLRHLVEVEPRNLPSQLQVVARRSQAAARRFGHHVQLMIELSHTEGRR